LETNRKAALKSYYRRQGKVNAMKDENDRLKMLVQRYGAHRLPESQVWTQESNV